MKKNLTDILMIGLSVFFLTGCVKFYFHPFVKAEKSQFVVDEEGNVHFQKGGQKEKKMTEKQKSKKKAGVTQDVAVIQTPKGVIVFKYFPDDAPIAVENFKKLAKKKFYDKLTFHRVAPGFVIQGGDPNGDGTGGPGYTIKDEFNARPHLEGTVGMARTAEPNSGGSQFYICLAPAPQLDGKYTVFGQVVEGLDVIHKIEKGDLIESVTIESREIPF